MFGLLNVCKPAGITSRDAVNQVQLQVKPAKVGHAGTLDPLATGVLVICLGRATRLVPYIQQMPKVYGGTFLLGRSSDTDDVEGKVVDLADAVVPTREEIEAKLPAFVGTIQQRPPSFSAIKVGGRRAYSQARKGNLLELPERPVEVYELEIMEYSYPVLKLRIRCGSGTYVRAIGRDLAASLGTGAVMSELTRSAIGCFTIDKAMSLDSLSRSKIEANRLPAVLAMTDRPMIRPLADELNRICNGQFYRMANHGFDGPVAAVDAAGDLIAILRPHDPHTLQPELVIGKP